MTRSLRITAILVALGFCLTVPARAQPMSVPIDPVVALLDHITIPAVTGTTPRTDVLQNYYRTYLAAESRAQVSEAQFVEGLPGGITLGEGASRSTLSPD